MHVFYVRIILILCHILSTIVAVVETPWTWLNRLPRQLTRVVLGARHKTVNFGGQSSRSHETEERFGGGIILDPFSRFYTSYCVKYEFCEVTKGHGCQVWGRCVLVTSRMNAVQFYAELRHDDRCCTEVKKSTAAEMGVCYATMTYSVTSWRVSCFRQFHDFHWIFALSLVSSLVYWCTHCIISPWMPCRGTRVTVKYLKNINLVLHTYEHCNCMSEVDYFTVHGIINDTQIPRLDCMMKPLTPPLASSQITSRKGLKHLKTSAQAMIPRTRLLNANKITAKQEPLHIRCR